MALQRILKIYKSQNKDSKTILIPELVKIRTKGCSIPEQIVNEYKWKCDIQWRILCPFRIKKSIEQPSYTENDKTRLYTLL